jgi:hypothetical protein
MSNTATDWLIFGSGFSGVSTYRCFDFGWVFTNSEPPPWPFSTSHDLPGMLLVVFRVGADQRDLSLPSALGHPDRAELRIDEVRAAPRVRDLVDVDQRPVLRSFESITAILFDWFAAVRK